MFAAPAPQVRLGDLLDPDSLAAMLEGIGYFHDDRIDEPGELAVRADLIDVFPPDTGVPLRIRLEEGRIALYDPVGQLGTGTTCERASLTPVIEPRGCDVTLLDHLPDAQVFVDADAQVQGERFGALWRDAGGEPDQIVGAEDWHALMANAHVVASDDLQAGERFIEGARPAGALAKAIAAAREAGDRVVLAGSARDIRFLSRRVEAIVGAAPSSVTHWREVAAAPPGALLAIEFELDRRWREPGLTVVAAADILGARAVEKGDRLLLQEAGLDGDRLLTRVREVLDAIASD